MRSPEFWLFYESLRAQLGARGPSFTKMFEHLDGCERPVCIIETGCTRQAGNWAGDGGSTLLFDKYAEFHPGSVVHTVDIDPAATQLCASLVSARVNVHTGDSVRFLRSLADAPRASRPIVDLLYLDSYDVNFEDAFPSAFHHIKELVAAAPLLHRRTLVAVDDSPASMNGFLNADGMIQLVTAPRIGGKGKLVAEYARHINAEQVFQGYQCGWTGLRDSPDAA